MAHGKATDKKTSTILENQFVALELRKSGLSYRKIAERLSINHQTAHNYVQKALAHLLELNNDSAEELRQLELERLDKITAAMDHWVEAGSFNHANIYLKAMERRSKYLGLDKPTEIKVDIQLFLKLQQAADEANVDLSEVFEALIRRFANSTITR